MKRENMISGVSANDLLGTSKSSLLFYPMFRLMKSLLLCEPKKSLSSLSIWFRKIIHPLLLLLVPLFMEYKQVMESKNQLLGINTPDQPFQLSKEPVIIYDGAHNPQGVAAAVRNVKLLFGEEKAVLLTGVMEDKDHANMVSSLAQIAHAVHTVKPSNPRAMSAERLALEFEVCGIPSKAHASFDAAVAAAVAEAERLSCPVIALGSLYMYADVFGAVNKCLSLRTEE